MKKHMLFRSGDVGYFSGENVKVEDFFQTEYKAMLDLDRAVYGPIKEKLN